jgi:hypothetical protein
MTLMGTKRPGLVLIVLPVVALMVVAPVAGARTWTNETVDSDGIQDP